MLIDTITKSAVRDFLEVLKPMLNCNRQGIWQLEQSLIKLIETVLENNKV